MSTVNLVVPGGSHSQLATNRVLIAMYNVFSSTAFTSRDVSNIFSLDFLYTAKKLSSMSRKPCYLLSVRKIPRAYGGLENEYTISLRGWKKILYLQKQKPALTKESSHVNPFRLTEFDKGVLAMAIALTPIVKERNELLRERSTSVKPCVNEPLSQRATQSTSPHQTTSSTREDTECKKCQDYEISLQDVKRSFKEERFERNSLEIKNAFLERDKRVLKRQSELREALIRRLLDSIYSNGICLGILGKEVEKFNLPLEAMPVKSLVYTGLAALVLLDYEALVASSP